MSIADNCSFAPRLDANGTFTSPSAMALASRCADELSGHYAAMARLAAFVCYQVLGAPISALGVIGNAMSIAVLTRRSMLWGVASTNCYLVALACSDMLYLLVLNFGVLGVFWQRVYTDDDTDNHFYASGTTTSSMLPSTVEAAASANDTRDDLLSTPASPTALQWKPHPCTIAAVNVLSNTSIWVVVAFTVERYVAVSYPIRGRVLCNPRRARWIVAATCIVVLLLHVPNFFELDADSGEETAMAQHPLYRIGYNWGVLAFLFAVLPMALLVVFNSLLIRSVSRAAVVRRRMTLGCEDSNSFTSSACISGGGCGSSGGAGGSNCRQYFSGGSSASAAPVTPTTCASAQQGGMAAAAAAAASSQRQQRSVTIMLVAVVMVFFLLHAPNAIVLVKTTYEDYVQEQAGTKLLPLNTELRRVAYAAVNFLILLSSSVNFLLYSALSRKFRQTLRSLVCGLTAVVVSRRTTPATATACETTVCDNLEVGWLQDCKSNQKGKRQSLLPLQGDCLTNASR